MDDNIDHLRQTGALKISAETANQITGPQATIVTILMGQNKELSEMRTDVRDAAGKAESARVEAAGLRTDVTAIKDLQKAANGSVNKLKADVALLQQKDADRLQQEVKGALVSKAVQNATKGIFVSPRMLATLGAFLMFLGFDNVVGTIHLLSVFFAHLTGK